MAKDPAFLFYPGDYLRDTQNLSEKSQVAYDRIMCEHMRNICISKQQLKFFTKKLNEEELEELMFMLIEVEGGYQIEWVAESISKRKDYSDSRRKNRTSKKEKESKDMLNISSSYVQHMENEIENENENIIEEEKEIEKSKKMKKVLFKDFDSIPISSENEQTYHSIAYAYFQLIDKNMDELNLPKNSLEKANALEWIKTVRLMIENKEATVQDFRDVRNYLLAPNCWWKGKILSLPAARGEKWLKLVSSMRSDVKTGKLKKPMEQQMKEATDYLQRLENVLNS